MLKGFNRKVFVMLCIFLSCGVFADNAPKPIGFEDGEQFSLNLSRFDYNRIYVEGEVINKIIYPEKTFIVSKNKDESRDTTDESIYLKPVFSIPVTLYIVTNKDHHFSITVKSDESLGKTLRFRLKNQTALKYVAPQLSESPDTDIEDVMSLMKEGHLMTGFKPVKVTPRPFYVKKNIRVILKNQYVSQNLSGYVYQLQNNSSHPIQLSTALFSNQKAALLSLSDEVLAPNQVAYLYGLYRREG